MVRRGNDAAAKGAQTFLRNEECALSMEQRKNANYAILEDAQIKLKRGECVRDTVHTATPLMNLLLSHRVSDQNLIRLL